MFRKFCCWLAAFFLAMLANAQTNDTLQAELRVVEIHSRPLTHFAAGSRITTIDSAALQRNSSASLAELLQRQTPLYLKTYGQGMLATVAFRGTAAEHTAVLWNGLNIQLPTLGLTDFSTLPTGAITNVQVQHGPASATYGSASIGGTVLLSSEIPYSQGWQLEAQQQTGSFGFRHFRTTNSYSTKKLALRTQLFHQSVQNNFPFQNTTKRGKPTERETNAASLNYGFTQDVQYRLSERLELAVRGWYNFTDREIQAGMGSAHQDAIQEDKNLRLLAELKRIGNNSETSIKTAYFQDQLDYFSKVVTESNSVVNTYQVQAEHTQQLLPSVLLRVGVNGQHLEADVSGYGEFKKEDRASAFGLLRYDPLPRLQLSLNLRQSWVEGFNPPPTPTLGGSWNFYHQGPLLLFLKANVARSYRVPTLNERFWPTGNPDLKPESGWGSEASVAGRFHKNKISAEAEFTAYHMQVQDWVQWQPFRNDWAPFNLQSVNSKGIEASAKIIFEQGKLRWHNNFGYTYTSSTIQESANPEHVGNQLMYVPRHNAQLNTGMNYGNWWLSLSGSYTGSRYIQNDNSRIMEAYSLYHLNLGKKFRLPQGELELQGQVHNLTNRAYQNLFYRAMPLRHYTFSVNFYFQHP